MQWLQSVDKDVRRGLTACLNDVRCLINRYGFVIEKKAWLYEKQHSLYVWLKYKKEVTALLVGLRKYIFSVTPAL